MILKTYTLTTRDCIKFNHMVIKQFSQLVKFESYKEIYITLIQFYFMDNSRSKSYRALNMAQPIKKEIDDTLTKLQIEKRKFLANQRQQYDLKDRIEKKRKEINQLKQREFQTSTNLNRVVQNTLQTKNRDRTFQNSINSLNQLQKDIQIKRKQLQKYKRLNNKLSEDIDNLEKNIKLMTNNVQEKFNESQTLKDRLIQFRQLNHKNTTEFQKSYFNLTRSDMGIQNERRKTAMLTKTFLGEQMKKSRCVAYDILSETLKQSGIQHNQNHADIMTDSVPLAKARVREILLSNKQKLRISDNYRKFGEGLQQMFQIMKNYKGRDDLEYLAQQFVAKERQIQQLQEYVSTLQGAIYMQKIILQAKKQQDNLVEKALEKKQQHQIDKQYEKLNVELQKQISKLKQEEENTRKEFQKIGEILQPLFFSQSSFDRSNIIEIMSQIQDHYDIVRFPKTKIAWNKSLGQPYIELTDNKVVTHELLSYDKMKQHAEQYIKSKQ